MSLYHLIKDTTWSLASAELETLVKGCPSYTQLARSIVYIYNVSWPVTILWPSPSLLSYFSFQATFLPRHEANDEQTKELYVPPSSISLKGAKFFCLLRPSYLRSSLDLHRLETYFTKHGDKLLFDSTTIPFWGPEGLISRIALCALSSPRVFPTGKIPRLIIDEAAPKLAHVHFSHEESLVLLSQMFFCALHPQPANRYWTNFFVRITPL